MSTWKSDYVQVNGLKLHYTRTGGTEPPLILVHGFTDDGLCWTPVAEALQGEFDIIMPDARGHGFSEAVESGYGPAEQASDLNGLIAALGIEKPIVLGHSMGAMTAVTLAGLYPDVAEAILLEDPPPWWSAASAPKEFDPEVPKKLRESLIQRKGQAREALIAAERLVSPTWSEAELGPWADSKLRLNPSIAELMSPTIPRSVDWSVVLPRVTCPALLITADPTLGAIITPETADSLHELIPQLTVAHIPKAGHSIHREQFDAYLHVVRTFIGNMQG